MPEILLIQPPIRDFYLTAKRTLPHGLAMMAGSLERAGFSVEILDGPASGKVRDLPLPPDMTYLDPYYGRPDRSPFALFHGFHHYGHSFDHLGRRAAASGAFLVGISSLFTPYADEALETAASVRRHHPEAVIVLGGHHPTAFPEAVMADESVDYVIRGEGENAIVALARALRGTGDLTAVPGLVRRTPKGLVVPKSAVEPDLDALPWPAWHQVRMDRYARRGQASVVVVASRGCPFRCAYCCVTADTVPHRRRSVEGVLAEVRDATHRLGAGFIDFEDENLSLDRDWFRSLLNGIIDSGASTEPRAMNGLFAPSLDEGVIRLMNRAGFRALNLSVGATAPEQLRRFRRPDVSEAAARAARIAAGLGMESVCYLIVGAPGQRAGDSLDDLLWLAEIPALAGVSVYYPAPGSAYWSLCAEQGLLPARFGLARSSCLPVSDTSSRLETVTLLRLGRVLNFMKALVRDGIALPAPAPIGPDERLDPFDRAGSGRRLLAAFFHDAVLRGLSPEGTPFPHAVEERLSARFVDGLRDL